MDKMMSEIQTECHQPCEGTAEGRPCAEQALGLHMAREQCLKQQNLSDIAALQAIMVAEEGEVLSTQQVLRRVLGFYNRYVPFMQ